MPAAGRLLQRRRLRRAAAALVHAPAGQAGATRHTAGALSTEAAGGMRCGAERAVMFARKNLLRPRGGHDHARVTYVELFFDLVFVFAVTQLSHGLLAHLTLLGALE